MIDVPRETSDRLDRLVAAVIAASLDQNLISAKTRVEIDSRHVADSVQLLPYVRPGPLLDIGSGAGFPGLALACCRPNDPCLLVEPRSKRAEFLKATAAELGLAHVRIEQCRVERVVSAAVVTITARAVASLDRLFTMAQHVADNDTFWVLPKGRSAESELEAACRTWQGDFELVPSQTDPQAAIVLARGIRRRR